MSKNFFDLLRILQIVLPGVAALYAALAKIWGWGYSAEVGGTVLAIVTFLGILLKIESGNYFKNKVIVDVEADTEIKG